MAKRRKRITTPKAPAADEPPSRRLVDQLPPELAPFRSMLASSPPPDEQAKAKAQELADARQEIDRINDIRDGLRPPPWQKKPEAPAQPAGPSSSAAADNTPKPVDVGANDSAAFAGLGPKVRLAADMVLALWREGYRWGLRDSLLRRVRERSGDKELSRRTLGKAIRRLRDRHLIDY